MTRGIECKRSSMKVNDLIQVRQSTPLQEPVSYILGKVVER
jgi:hypothetical protein